MLPGNVYADPTVTRYHKTQLLGIKDNTICGECQISRRAQPAVQIQTAAGSFLPETRPHSRYKNVSPVLLLCSI